MKFKCENCGSEKLEDIICHGHKISYKDNNFVCADCHGKELSDQEITECLPKCCNKMMTPM